MSRNSILVAEEYLFDKILKRVKREKQEREKRREQRSRREMISDFVNSESNLHVIKEEDLSPERDRVSPHSFEEEWRKVDKHPLDERKKFKHMISPVKRKIINKTISVEKINNKKEERILYKMSGEQMNFHKNTLNDFDFSDLKINNNKESNYESNYGDLRKLYSLHNGQMKIHNRYSPNLLSPEHVETIEITPEDAATFEVGSYDLKSDPSMFHHAKVYHSLNSEQKEVAEMLLSTGRKVKIVISISEA